MKLKSKKTIKLFCMVLLCVATVIILYGCNKKKSNYYKAENYNFYEKEELLLPVQDIKDRISDGEKMIYPNPSFRILSGGKEKCLCVMTFYTSDNDENKVCHTYNDLLYFCFSDGSIEALPNMERLLDGYRITAGTICDEKKLIICGFSEELSQMVFAECDLHNGTIQIIRECEEDYKYCMGFDGEHVYGVTVSDEEQLNVMKDDMSIEKSFKTHSWSVIQSGINECLILQDNKTFVNYSAGKMENSELILPEVLTGLTENDYVIAGGDDNYNYYFGFGNNTEGGKEIPQEYKDCFWGVKDGAIYSLFDFKSMGLETGSLCAVVGGWKEGFLLEFFNGFNNYRLYYLKQSNCEHNYSSKEGKTELLIVGLTEPDELHKVIASFNEESKDYYVTYIDYNTQYNDFLSAKEGITVALSADRQADAVLLNGLNRDGLIEKGIITDLSDYVVKSEVLDEKYFVSSVWDALNDEGKIYSLYPEYSLFGFFSLKETDFDAYDSFDRYLNSDQIVFAGNSSESVLADMLTYSGNQVIDSDKKALVEAQSNYLRNTLCVLKNQNSYVSFASLPAEKQVIQKEALIHPTKLEMPYSYYYEKYLFGGDIHYSCVGGNNCIIVPSLTNLALMSYSRNSEGVYAFFDYMFREDIYHQYFGKVRFPVSRLAWDDWIQRLSADCDYTNRFGEQIRIDKFTYGGNDVITEFGPMDSSEIGELKELVENAVYFKPMDSKYVSVIEEESALYLEGNRDLDKTISVIENRVGIALNE